MNTISSYIFCVTWPAVELLFLCSGIIHFFLKEVLNSGNSQDRFSFV